MFKFILFNVGHGFCAYATTPGGGNMLFDCGYDSDLQFYPSRYFKDRSIGYISSLHLSHFDQDHVANLASSRAAVTFGSIVRNPTVPSSFIRREKERIGSISAGMESALDMHSNWTGPVLTRPNFGGVKVTTFYNSYPRFTDMNNLSLVTFLQFSGCGIVIPGDLECGGWEALIENAGFCDCLRETTIFIASHHGRNAGYCEKVFNFCSPHLILLSDKGIVYSSQEHDYAKHSQGVEWSGGYKRRVLTTRADGHIMIQKQVGEPALVTTNLTL